MAYNFDGIDDYINFGDAPEFRFGTNDFSISLWIKSRYNSHHKIVLGKMAPTPNFNQYIITANFISSPTGIRGVCRDNNTASRDLGSYAVDSINWHHIVLVHTQGLTSFYVDNSLKASNSSTANSFQNLDVAGYPLVAGYRNWDDSLYYNGQIDDIRIYARALSLSDIDSLFQLPNPNLTTNTALLAKENKSIK